MIHCLAHHSGEALEDGSTVGPNAAAARPRSLAPTEARRALQTAADAQSAAPHPAEGEGPPAVWWAPCGAGGQQSADVAKQ